MILIIHVICYILPQMHRCSITVVTLHMMLFVNMVYFKKECREEKNPEIRKIMFAINMVDIK